MRRKIIIAYKYVAIAAFFIVFCHVVLLLIGCPLELAEDLVTFAPVPAVIAIGLSWVLGYCMTHRLCLGAINLSPSLDHFGKIVLIIGIAIQFDIFRLMAIVRKSNPSLSRTLLFICIKERVPPSTHRERTGRMPEHILKIL